LPKKQQSSSAKYQEALSSLSLSLPNHKDETEELVISGYRENRKRCSAGANVEIGSRV